MRSIFTQQMQQQWAYTRQPWQKRRVKTSRYSFCQNQNWPEFLEFSEYEHNGCYLNSANDHLADVCNRENPLRCTASNYLENIRRMIIKKIGVQTIEIQSERCKPWQFFNLNKKFAPYRHKPAMHSFPWCVARLNNQGKKHRSSYEQS
jgi:hypothetical protein